jgi:hypothetical protein
MEREKEEEMNEKYNYPPFGSIAQFPFSIFGCAYKGGEE